MAEFVIPDEHIGDACGFPDIEDRDVRNDESRHVDHGPQRNVADAEGDHIGSMEMDDRFHIGPEPVDLAVNEALIK